MLQTNKKLLKVCKSGLRVINEGESSPLLLAEPDWVPDKMNEKCSSCNKKFTFTHRKHHCRRCGRCFCGGCCKEKVDLFRMSFIDPVLHCRECSLVSKMENQFFQSDLPFLIKGELLNVCMADDGDHVPTFCKLSPTHKSIKFLPASRSALLNIDSMDLSQMRECLITTSPEDQTSITNLKLIFNDSHEQLQTTTISSSNSNNNHAQQIAWLKAFQKCFTMIDQGRQNVSSMDVEN